MKNYTITVNGNVYNVTVEEGTAAPVYAAPVAPAPVVVPVAAPVAAPAPAASAGAAGSIKVEAGAAGKIVGIDAKPGTAVKKGDAIVTLEVMKMETPVVAPQDGTVASIDVNVGDMVEAGKVLATMN